MGYSPWGRDESDMTEHTHTHTNRNRFTDAENRFLVARGDSSEGRMDGSLELADANNCIQDG